MNRKIPKSEHHSHHVNLGEPLPLTYKPRNNNQPHSLPRLQPQQSQSLPDSQIPRRIIPKPIRIRTPVEQIDTSQTLNNDLEDNSSSKKRIKTKLRLLLDEIDKNDLSADDIYSIDERLSDLINNLNDLHYTEELKHLEQELEHEQPEDLTSNEKDLKSELNNAKYKLKRLTSIENKSESSSPHRFKQLRVLPQSWFFWIGILAIIVLYLTSSFYMAEFKYQYCYSFC